MNYEFRVKQYPAKWVNCKFRISFHNNNLPNFQWEGWHIEFFNISIWYGKYLTQQEDTILPPKQNYDGKNNQIYNTRRGSTEGSPSG